MQGRLIRNPVVTAALINAAIWLGGFSTSHCIAADPTTKPAGALDLSDYSEPPDNGGSNGAVGGLTRSNSTLPEPTLYTTLNRLPLTSKAQPILYFYVPFATPAKVDVTFRNYDTDETIIAPTLEGISRPGMQRFDFASTGKSLDPNVTYCWTVAVRSKEKQPAKDNSYHVNIRYVEPSPELKSQLDGKPAAAQAAVFAKNHLWFDTVAAAIDVIKSNPGDPSVKEQFQKLLKAGNCPVPADAAGANP